MQTGAGGGGGRGAEPALGRLGLRFDRAVYEQSGKLKITEIVPLGPADITRQVKPGDYRGTWSHASLLRTVEDAFGLPHLAQARTAHPVSGIWR